MIHIATVHWKTDRWIDIQLRYLRKYINEEFRVYAFLNGIDTKYKKLFYYTLDKDIQEHYIKLNLLGEVIKLSSKNKNEDLIFFLDGDAFPIGDIVTFVREKISSHKLIAIQRIENCGDVQPHPAFCATTVGFWAKINGTWAKGFEWKDNYGCAITDVGGELLKILMDNKINWLPLLRSGQLSSHPVWFGIYENLIYHHGAGFRTPVSRYDDRAEINDQKYIYCKKIINKLPYTIRRILFSIKFFSKLNKSHRINQNISVSHNIYDKLLSKDFSFNQYS